MAEKNVSQEPFLIRDGIPQPPDNAPGSPSMQYIHTQWGQVGFLVFFVISALVGITFFFRRTFNIVIYIEIAAGVTILFSFLYQRETVGGSGGPFLRVRFGPLPFGNLLGSCCNNLDLRQVRTIEIIDDLPWYHGYGIRITKYGWMFRLSWMNNKCVKILCDSEKGFVIGTDDPEGLLAACNAARWQADDV